MLLSADSRRDLLDEIACAAHPECYFPFTQHNHVKKQENHKLRNDRRLSEEKWQWHAFTAAYWDRYSSVKGRSENEQQTGHYNEKHTHIQTFETDIFMATQRHAHWECSCNHSLPSASLFLDRRTSLLNIFLHWLWWLWLHIRRRHSLSIRKAQRFIYCRLFFCFERHYFFL